MKKPTRIIVFLLLLITQAIAQKKTTINQNLPNFYKARSEMLDKMKNADEIEATAGETDGLYAKFKRWEHFMHQRTYPSGNFFSPDALINEFNRYQANRKINLNIQNANWNAIGPFAPPTAFDSLLAPGIGRINCIALHPTDSNILFVGTACGGIWRSIDGGINWASSNDALPSMSITDISINPLNPDTIYAATGDAPGNWVFDTGWNLFFPGGHYACGILMSTDGGQTWNQTGLTYTQAQTAVIYRVIVNPVQTNIVMAATAKGLYRSTDAGLNWVQVDTNKIYDLMLNPLDASQAYAVAGRKIKRSFDYGATWISFPYNLPAPASVARLAMSAADTSIIMLAKSNGFVMKSINGGINFTLASNIAAFGHQDGYDKPIAMSPVDANVVYVGIVPILKSNNGGVNWTDISSFVNTRPNYIHPDFHGLAFSPFNPTKLYAVNDGGVYVSNDSGATWISLNNGIGISQYYKVSSSYTMPDLILGGTQDNSTHRYDGTNWRTVIGGDGMDNAVDFTDENICYASWQFGNFSRSNNGGLSFGTSIRPPGLIGNWVTPIAMNPHNSSNIYIGGAVVHNSYDNGNTWQVISPVIDNVDLITVLETAPADSSIIVAASLGVLQKTIDHGANWTNIVTGLPIDTAGISDVAISDDAQTMWVCFSGFVDGYKIFKTTDGGLNWTNISGTLPNVPFNCIEYQKGTTGDLYVGCDFGVYYKNDTMSDWISYNTGMPYVMIWDLDLNYGNGKLRAATYGRSMYETETFTPVQFIQTDAGVASIIQPFTDSYCDSLTTYIVATIRNYGSDTLTSVTINYQVDNGTIDSVLWSGSLPKNATITDTLSQATFFAGSHTVHVFTSNPNNSVDQFVGNDHKQTTLKVDTVITSFPLSQGFEIGGLPPENWSLSGSSNIWIHDTTAGAYGLSSSSVYANFYSVQSGTQNLVSPRIDLSTATAPAYLYFSHASATYDSTYIDTLGVSISNDCGITWTNLFLKWGPALNTTPQFFLNPFVPADSNWVTNIIDISTYIGQTIKVRFEARSGFGNSCYLDDINIFHTAVALEEYQLDNLNIKPNPSNGLFYLVDKSHIVNSYVVFNSEGKQIKQNNTVNDNVIDLRNQPNGLYFVRLTTDKNTVVRKLNISR